MNQSLDESKMSEVEFKFKAELVDLLLECPTINEKMSREILVRQLPPGIQNAIEQNNRGIMHVFSIVETCINYMDNGLDQLIDRLGFFDGKTKQFYAITDFIKNNDFDFSPKSKSRGLPARVPQFVGRKNDLNFLIKSLCSGEVITLCGPGGIGKTALVSQALHKLKDDGKLWEHFPDGVYQHTFGDDPNADSACETIARFYNVCSGTALPENVLETALACNKALLVLDGAENTNNLRKITDRRNGCGVIVTSRSKKDIVDKLLPIKCLGSDDAINLLQKWAGNQIDRDTAVRICEVIGDLPFAVRIAGQYLAQKEETATEYLKWLEEAPFEVLSYTVQDQDGSVRRLIAKNIEQVEVEAKNILALVGQLAFAPFAKKTIEKISELPELFFRKAFQQLIEYGLFSYNKEQKLYEVTHRLIHTYAHDYLIVGAEARKVELMDKLADWYTTLFTEPESTKGFDGGYHRLLDIERKHMVNLIEEYKKLGKWEMVRKLVGAIGQYNGYLAMQGYITEWRQVLKAGITAAEKLKKQQDEVTFRGNFGDACRQLGQIEESFKCHEEALEIARRIGYRKGEGNQLGYLGLACRDSKNSEQIKEAVEYLKQALKIFREDGDRKGEGHWLGSLGQVYRVRGEIKEAVECYEKALKIFKEIGGREKEGVAYCDLGFAYRDLGQVKKAIEHHKEALDIFRKTKEQRREGNVLIYLGNIYHDDQAKEKKAVESYKDALEIIKKIGGERGKDDIAGINGHIHYIKGDFEQAAEHYEQASKIAKKINSWRGQGNWLGNLGNACSRLNQTEKAIKQYEEAARIMEEYGDRKGEAFWCWKHGLLCEKDNPAHAVKLMSIRVEFEREIRHPDAESHSEKVGSIKKRAS